jgi:hypothetical protein
MNKSQSTKKSFYCVAICQYDGVIFDKTKKKETCIQLNAKLNGTAKKQNSKQMIGSHVTDKRNVLLPSMYI